MHQQVLNSPDGLVPDHKDGNGLNNQRRNLRPATISQNNVGRRVPAGVSGYRGVYWYEQTRKWIVRLRVNGKKKQFGTFNDPVLAAMRYDEITKVVNGEFAVLNFPENG